MSGWSADKWMRAAHLLRLVEKAAIAMNAVALVAAIEFNEATPVRVCAAVGISATGVYLAAYSGSRRCRDRARALGSAGEEL